MYDLGILIGIALLIASVLVLIALLWMRWYYHRRIEDLEAELAIWEFFATKDTKPSQLFDQDELPTDDTITVTKE